MLSVAYAPAMSTATHDLILERDSLRAEIAELRHMGRDFTPSFAAKLQRLRHLNAMLDEQQPATNRQRSPTPHFA
jgi:hypothetical protein